jgi:hypothetical protein
MFCDLAGSTALASRHAHCGKLLLHAGRGVRLLQAFYIRGNVVRPEGTEGEAALLAPGEEPAAGAGICTAYARCGYWP